jgi:hypothetical protein
MTQHETFSFCEADEAASARLMETNLCLTHSNASMKPSNVSVATARYRVRPRSSNGQKISRLRSHR